MTNSLAYSAVFPLQKKRGPWRGNEWYPCTCALLQRLMSLTCALQPLQVGLVAHVWRPGLLTSAHGQTDQERSLPSMGRDGAVPPHRSLSKEEHEFGLIPL